MSANQWINCGKCQKLIQDKLKEQYGRLSQDEYNLFKEWAEDSSIDADEELKKILEKIKIEIHSSKWDAEYNSDFESAYDYGYGTIIDDDGNLCFQYSGTCDCCGIEHNIEVILPEGVTDNQEYKIDLRGIDLKKLKKLLNDVKSAEDAKCEVEE